MRIALFTVISLLMTTRQVESADWPQYRGPNRDDVSTETGLLKKWPKQGPKLAWTYSNAGVGYSGMAVVGSRLYSIGGRGDDEFLFALDLGQNKNGTVKQAWAVRVGPLFTFKSNQWSAGPSATPTVDNDRIYALGGNGDLICVEAATGKEVWRKNLPKDLSAQVNPIGGGPKNLGWGFTWSPLVDNDRLICVPGGPKGTVAALDKKTGKLIWQSTDFTDRAAYTSPMAATIGGVRQYVVLTNSGLYGVAAKDGRLLWKSETRYRTEVVNSPLVHGATFYTTVGAGGGCRLTKVSKAGDTFQVETVFENRNLQNHHGNVVRVGEVVYGYSQRRGWICQDLKTGKINWSERRKLGAGSVVFADGHLYCYTERDGTVALVKADQNEFREVSRFKIPSQSTLRKRRGGVWTPPIIAGGKLYLRDQENIYCYDVKATR